MDCDVHTAAGSDVAVLRVGSGIHDDGLVHLATAAGVRFYGLPPALRSIGFTGAGAGHVAVACGLRVLAHTLAARVVLPATALECGVAVDVRLWVAVVPMGSRACCWSTARVRHL